MGNPRIGIDVDANLKGLRDQLSEVKGITDKEAKTLVAGLSKTWKSAEKASKDSAKKTGDSWKSTFQLMAGSAKTAGFGSLVEKTTALSTAMTALLDPVTLAVAGVAGVAAVAAGAALAYGALGVSLVEAGFSAKAAQKELAGFKALGSDFYPVVSPEAQSSIDALAASGKALTSIYDALTVTVGANVAPGIEHLTDVVVGAALTAEEWFAQWAEGKDLLVEFGKFIVESFLRTFQPLSDAVRLLGNSYIYLSEALGHEVSPQLKAAMASTEGLRDALVAQGVALAGNLGSLDDLAAKGHDFIRVQERATTAVDDQKKALEAQKKALDALAEGLQPIVDAYHDYGKQIADLAKLTKSATDDQLDDVGKVGAAQQDQLDQALAAKQAAVMDSLSLGGSQQAAELRAESAYADAVVAINEDAAAKIKVIEEKKAKDAAKAQADLLKKEVDGIVQGMSALSGALGDAYGEQVDRVTALEDQLHDTNVHMTEAQKKELSKRIAAEKKVAAETFGIQKALRLAIAVVNTAEAVTGALADYPYPYSLIPAGLAAAAGAVEVGAIASEQPKFHAGGLVGPQARTDEVQATLLTDEAVLSRQGRRTVGDDAIRRANAGIGDAPAIRVVAEQHYRHQSFNRFIRDNLRQRGPLRDAIQGQSGIVGHRAREDR